MNDTNLYPIGEAFVSDIRKVTEPGFFLPVKGRTDPILITKWDDAMYGVVMEGVHSFCYFHISSNTRFEGVFIPSPDILVDYSSIKNGMEDEESLGKLFLSNEGLSVVATLVGDGRFDATLLPLWGNKKEGSEYTKVCFARWGLGIPTPTGHRIIWQFEYGATNELED